MPYSAPETRVLAVGSNRSCLCNFAGLLAINESISAVISVETFEIDVADGTETSTADLTPSAAAANQYPVELANGSRVQALKAVQFTLTGGVAGKSYFLLVTVGTTDGQTLPGRFYLESQKA